MIPTDESGGCPVNEESDCECPGDLKPSFVGSDKKCSCPAGTKVSPSNPQKCDSCITCSGDLMPKSNSGVCPVNEKSDCECPVGFVPTFLGSTVCECKKRTCPSDAAKTTMFRLKDDGKCEEKCFEPKDFAKKLGEGFGFCPCDCLPRIPNVCNVCEKPVSLVFKYTPSDDRVANSQGDKSKVVGNVNGDTSVYISCGEDVGKSHYFAGPVLGDAEFQITNKSSPFKANVYCTIYSEKGGSQLQYAKIQTSCSTPIVENDKFGSLQLIGYLGEKSKTCGFGVLVGGISSVVAGGTTSCGN